MLHKLSSLLCKTHEQKLRLLEQENQELRKKLYDKQEHINRTNAYWKAKLKKNYKEAIAI